MFKQEHKLLKSKRMLRICGGAKGGMIEPLLDKVDPKLRKQCYKGSWDIKTPTTPIE